MNKEFPLKKIVELIWKVELELAQGRINPGL